MLVGSDYGFHLTVSQDRYDVIQVRIPSNRISLARPRLAVGVVRSVLGVGTVSFSLPAERAVTPFCVSVPVVVSLTSEALVFQLGGNFRR